MSALWGVREGVTVADIFTETWILSTKDLMELLPFRLKLSLYREMAGRVDLSTEQPGLHGIETLLVVISFTGEETSWEKTQQKTIYSIRYLHWKLYIDVLHEILNCSKICALLLYCFGHVHAKAFNFGNTFLISSVYHYRHKYLTLHKLYSPISKSRFLFLISMLNYTYHMFLDKYLVLS